MLAKIDKPTMTIGLYFGSFNPIHNGHLMLAQYMLNFGGVDEVWFVVSPQNPFKQDKTMAHAEDRVEMVRRAISQSPSMKVCAIELSLPTPSYTANTLDELRKNYPGKEWVIIMGGDNVPGLPRWHRAADILQHRILVYPRPGYERKAIDGSDIMYTDAPMIDISSTLLRDWVMEGKSIEHYVAHDVAEYIEQKGLYK